MSYIQEVYAQLTTTVMHSSDLVQRCLPGLHSSFPHGKTHGSRKTHFKTIALALIGNSFKLL